MGKGNAGDNDGIASHRILHGDCNRLFGVNIAEEGMIAINITVILALAFAITTGMTLTAAFSFSLIPLGF
jgi:hypothetical protein